TRNSPGPIRAALSRRSARRFMSNKADTAALVRCPVSRDKVRMIASTVRTTLRVCARWALDFALPPRCACCGTIVADVHSFCAECWKQIAFLGDAGCRVCGLPLQATESTTCAVCLAKPPRIARTRSAVAYDDLSRGLA